MYTNCGKLAGTRQLNGSSMRDRFIDPSHCEREEVVVRVSQIRRIGRVFDTLVSTFLDSSHGHLTEDFSCQLSTPNPLDFLP